MNLTIRPHSSLPHNHRPQPQKIQLFGSWTSYTTSIPMERDVRAGHGIWKSGGPKGGLEQGAVYGYYYVIDGKTIYYDPAAGRTVRDDRTGRVVNVIEVPIEMPSEEDQRLREKVSMARMMLEREQGKVEGGGDIRGQERSYNELDLSTQQHHPRPLPRRAKTDLMLSSSAPQAPAPPPLSHQLHHHTGHYDYVSPSPHRASRVDNARPRSSKGVLEQESMSSLRQYLTRSESTVSSGGPSATVDQQHPPPKLLLRRTTQATQFLPLQGSPRRKPVPKSTVKDATSTLPLIAPRADVADTRKPYTFLGRKISIPLLNSPPIPGKQLAVESNSQSQLEPFYSPYPPPPPPQFSSTDQNTPSPIYPPESRNSEVYPAVSKKESGSQRKRWPFLPQSAGKSKAIPIPGAAISPFAEPAAPSPRRKLGRLFSLSSKPAAHNPIAHPIAHPRAELHTGNFSVNTTYGTGSGTSVETHRMHNTPSPLDIPPPPEFVVAGRHRTRPLEQEPVRDGRVTRDEATRDGRVTQDGGRSRGRVDFSIGVTAQETAPTKKTAKKNSDSPNLGGETLGAEAQAETAWEAPPPVGPTTIAQLARERMYLGESPAREIAGLGLGAGLRAGGQEGRVRGSFLQDRETRLENIMLRDEDKSASGGRRLPRLAGGVLRSGLLSASPSLTDTRGGGGFVMVGHGMDGGGGESETGTGEESGFGRGYLKRYEEAVSTPGTIIRLDPDEFRPRKEPEQEPSVSNNLNSDGNLERIDLGNNYDNNNYINTTNGEDWSGYDSGSSNSRSSSSTETDPRSAGQLTVQTQGVKELPEGNEPAELPQTPSIIKTTTLHYTSSFLDTAINTSPITIIPSRLSSCGDNRNCAGAGDSSYHSSFNSYSGNSLDASPREPASPISPNTSTSNSPESTPSSPSPSYSPKTTITGNPKPLAHGLDLDFSTLELDFEQTIKVPRFRPRKRLELGAFKGGNRDIGPYVGDVILRNQVQEGEEVAYADDDDEVEVGWNGVAIADGGDGPEGDEGVTVDGGGGGVELLAGEGDGGVYRSPGSGRVRYLKSLRCLRDEVQGELDGRREMWEELGWLGGAVV